MQLCHAVFVVSALFAGVGNQYIITSATIGAIQSKAKSRTNSCRTLKNSFHANGAVAAVRTCCRHMSSHLNSSVCVMNCCCCQVAEHVLRGHLYRQPGETSETAPTEPGIMDLMAGEDATRLANRHQLRSVLQIDVSFSILGHGRRRVLELAANRLTCTVCALWYPGTLSTVHYLATHNIRKQTCAPCCATS
jgi:hypothetical protein